MKPSKALFPFLTAIAVSTISAASAAINPHFPALRTGHRLFQRSSRQKQIPSNQYNKTMKHQKPLIAMALAAIAFTASSNAAVLTFGDEIGVDFGPTAPTNNFNQVSSTTVPGGSLADGTLINTSNVTVDNVGFAWSANNAWFNNNDSISTGAPAVFNDSNTTDWMGITNSGGPTGVITLTFTGLNDLFTYDLVIGARFGQNIANTSWTVDGQTLLADALSDTNAFRSFTNLSTDGAGNLVMTGTGATSRLDLATVSALHLTAIPEPSSALLSALGLLALLRRRR